eukprot:20895-Heterococcus_DN1.PRE.5
MNKQTPPPGAGANALNNSNNNSNNAIHGGNDDVNGVRDDDQWPRTEGEVFYLYKRYVNLFIVQKIMTQLQSLDNAIATITAHNAEIAAADTNNNDSDTEDSLLTNGENNNNNHDMLDMLLFIRLVDDPAAWDTDNRPNDTPLWSSTMQHSN